MVFKDGSTALDRRPEDVTMTALLEQVYRRLAGLSAADQDRIASLILAELEADARWAEAFVSSSEQLGELAEEALAEREVSAVPRTG